MDYLIRDSYHAGVQYAEIDMASLIATIKAIPRPTVHLGLE